MADEKDNKPAPPEGQAPPSPQAGPSPATPSSAAPSPAGPPQAAAPPPAPKPPAPKADLLKAPVPSPAVDLLKERFPDQVAEVSYHAGEAIVRLRKERLIEVLKALRDEAATRFDFLSNLTAVHWPQRTAPFEVVYNLFSIPGRRTLTVKLDLAEGEDAPTAVVVWPTANWFEREVFDLFGIRFSGHPDLTRILMTDEWVGHPLRKDYPLEGKPEDHVQYREVTTAEHVYTYPKAPIRGFGWKKEVEKTGTGNG
jgi:NADH-quinone oxidoreductase subunit C